MLIINNYKRQNYDKKIRNRSNGFFYIFFMRFYEEYVFLFTSLLLFKKRTQRKLELFILNYLFLISPTISLTTNFFLKTLTKKLKFYRLK